MKTRATLAQKMVENSRIKQTGKIPKNKPLLSLFLVIGGHGQQLPM